MKSKDRIRELEQEVAEWRERCGAEVRKTDEIRGLVEPYTQERAKVVDMVRDAVAQLAAGERPIPDGYYLYSETDKRIGWMDKCIVWWKPDGCGYTNDLRFAGVYDEAYRKANKKHKELRFVPCQAVHAAAKTSTHVWIEDLNRALQERKKAKCQSQTRPQ